MNQPKRKFVHRADRQKSYLIVRVLKSKALPFLAENARLVDLNEGGMKLSFSVDIKAKELKVFWIEVPTVNGNSSTRIKARVRWYDGKSFTMGVLLEGLTDNDILLLKHYMKVYKELGLGQT